MSSWSKPTRTGGKMTDKGLFAPLSDAFENASRPARNKTKAGCGPEPGTDGG
jgi:hypothetical protein